MSDPPDGDGTTPLPIEREAVLRGILDWLDQGGSLRDLLGGVYTLAADGVPPSPVNGHDGPALEAIGEGTHPDYTDLRNSNRFAARFGEKVRYDASQGRWRLWKNGNAGGRWALDDTEHVVGMAKQMVMGEYQRLPDIPAEQRRAVVKELVRAEDAARVRATLALAQPELSITQAQLDADPYLLNTRSGVVDLRTGAVRPAKPEDLVAKMCGAEYDPDCPCPRWWQFLGEIFAEDAEIIAFVQRALGLSLIGEVLEHVLFVCHGPGRNGKTVLLGTVMDILGDYAHQTQTDALVTAQPRHPEWLATLQGSRLVVASEIEEGQHLNKALLKHLTGGDRRTARFMRQNSWEYEPVDTWWLATNVLPQVKSVGPAVWARIRRIPFTVTIPPEQRDPRLRQHLRREWPGILAWMVQGTADYLREGLGTAQAVEAATEEYRHAEDPLGEFFEERCELEQGNVTTMDVLFQGYVAWCGDHGQKPVTRVWLGRLLSERPDVVPTRLSNQRAWAGIALKGSARQASFAPD